MEPDGESPTALAVLHADDQLAVVDKPAGLMVHDSALARGETVSGKSATLQIPSGSGRRLDIEIRA